jgi:MFS family permease
VGGYPVAVALSLSNLGQSKAFIGTIATVPWLMVLLGAMFVPTFAKRFGLRVTCLVGLSLSLVSVGLFLTGTTWAIVASALVMGCGLALRWIACDTWIVALAPADSRGRVIGLHETLMGFGIALGPVVLLLADQLQTDPFYILAIVLVISGVAFLGPAAEPQEMETEDTPAPGSALLPLLFFASIAAVMSGFIEASSISLLPLYFLDAGLSETISVWLLVSFGLGGTLLQLPIGYLADQRGFKSAQRFCFLIIAIGAFANIVLATNPLPLMILVFLWGGVVGGLNTLAVIEAGSRSPAAQVGQSMALIATAYTQGGVVGPVALGGLWSLFDATFVMITSIGLSLAALLLRSLAR